MSKRDPRVIKSSFDVWLARDMDFNNLPGRNIKTYRRFTKATKIKYTNKICSYLDKMEYKQSRMAGENKVAVAIKLDGTIRYVWRCDVLTEKEYNEIQNSQKDNIRNLCKK